MLRSLILVAGLMASAPALACAGGNCDKSHCQMSSNADYTAQLAAVDAAAGEKVALEVTGMKCGSCSAKILAALKAIEGVTAVAVSAPDGQAKVAFDAAKVDSAKLIAAIQGLGFEAKLPDQA